MARSGRYRKDGSLGPKPPRLLSAMRWVLEHDGPDLTGVKRFCRKIMEENPVLFLQKMAMLEKELMKSFKGPAKPATVAPVEEDEGMDRMMRALRGKARDGDG